MHVTVCHIKFGSDIIAISGCAVSVLRNRRCTGACTLCAINVTVRVQFETATIKICLLGLGFSGNFVPGYPAHFSGG